VCVRLWISVVTDTSTGSEATQRRRAARARARVRALALPARAPAPAMAPPSMGCPQVPRRAPPWALYLASRRSRRSSSSAPAGHAHARRAAAACHRQRCATCALRRSEARMNPRRSSHEPGFVFSPPLIVPILWCSSITPRTICAHVLLLLRTIPRAHRLLCLGVCLASVHSDRPSPRFYSFVKTMETSTAGNGRTRTSDGCSHVRMCNKLPLCMPATKRRNSTSVCRGWERVDHGDARAGLEREQLRPPKAAK
jgi:hypothetical protein